MCKNCQVQAISPKVLRSMPVGKFVRFAMGVKTTPNFETRTYDEERVATIIWRWQDEHYCDRMSEFELSTGEYLGDEVE